MRLKFAKYRHFKALATQYADINARSYEVQSRKWPKVMKGSVKINVGGMTNPDVQ